jgi:hypothetical protein
MQLQGVGATDQIWRANSMRLVLRGAHLAIQQGLPGTAALELLRPCMDRNDPSFLVAGTLSKDEWIDFDDAVNVAYLDELTVVPAFTERGLLRRLSNPFGTVVSEWETAGEMTGAQINIRAGTPPEFDLPEMATVGVPVPVISKGFALDERHLEASRMRGDGLDITAADAASRVVSEAMDNLVMNGWSGGTFGSYTLHGLTTHPSINTGSIAGDWSTFPTVTGGAIVGDVLEAIALLHGDNVGPPYVLFVPYGWQTALANDYVVTVGASPSGVAAPGGGTIGSRILAINGIQAIIGTRALTAGVLLVAMRRNVVDLAWGFAPRLVQWNDQGGLTNYFRVLSIMAPRVKSDASGRSGIAYLS